MDRIGREPPKSQQRSKEERAGRTRLAYDSPMFASLRVLAGFRRIPGLGATYPTGLPLGTELFRKRAFSTLSLV
ncbi:unnamed protein product [Lasius platythorax]|uniref:Uncharacterized protein n=1 Tax=Lasius platythorax TaxID=488582 RepID=A0AAV2NS55_9HYME